MTPLARTILAAVSAEPGEWSYRTLAEDLDVTHDAVKQAVHVLRRAGRDVVLVANPAQRAQARRVEMVRRMHFDEGLSYDECAAMLANYVCEGTAATTLRLAGVIRRSAAAEAREIVRREPKQWTSAELARRCGCTQRNVVEALTRSSQLGALTSVSDRRRTQRQEAP